MAKRVSKMLSRRRSSGLPQEPGRSAVGVSACSMVPARSCRCSRTADAVSHRCAFRPSSPPRGGPRRPTTRSASPSLGDADRGHAACARRFARLRARPRTRSIALGLDLQLGGREQEDPGSRLPWRKSRPQTLTAKTSSRFRLGPGATMRIIRSAFFEDEATAMGQPSRCEARTNRSASGNAVTPSAAMISFEAALG